MAIRRYLGRLRRQPPRWRAAWTARATIRNLRRLKSSNPGRPFFGILLTEHIGDIIACEPVIGRLRRLHPDAFLVWVVRPAYKGLISSHPNLDAVVCVDSLLEVASVVKSKVFDRNVDLHVHLKVTNVEGVFYDNVSGDPSITAYNYFLNGNLLEALSKAAGLQPFSAAPTIYLPEDTADKVGNLGVPGHFVVVHTTSNMTFKDWSRAKWHDLIEYILEHYDTHVVEVGLDPSLGLSHPRFISLSGRLSLVETAEVIRRADFFLGIDSGPAHMANAWRTPGLLLFGRMYGSDSFNPYGGYYSVNADRVILRYPGPLSELSVDEVKTALDSSELWRLAVRNHKPAP